jgi:type I restriction enzyme S subunit
VPHKKNKTMKEEQHIKQLPKGWKWVKVSSVADLFRGINYTKDVASSVPFKDSLPILRGNNINGELNFDDLVYVPRNLIKNDQLIRKDDIIFAMSSGSKHLVGKSAVAKSDFDGSYGAFCAMLRINGEANKKYISYIFKGNSYRKLISEIAKGTNINNLKREHILDFKFPLPPLPTQLAIVSKIEELFSELDKGIENLRTAQQQLKTYRQAVLKWAFEGKLTVEWRNEKEKLATGKAFIKQLRDEREQQNKIRKIKLKPIPTIEDDELTELPKLPNEFAWARLGELLWSVKDGPHYSPKYQSTGIPFISGGNIRPTGIDFSNSKFISEKLHCELSQRCKPEKGDVLYTKGGTTGIARVNTYDIEFNVWVHVAVLKTLESVNPFYLEHALNSNHCYKQSQKYTHGVGNQDLGLTRMILITLPICSTDEQHAVVQEIESRLSVADKMEESISQSLQQAEALRQSILKRAFEGLLLIE